MTRRQLFGRESPVPSFDELQRQLSEWAQLNSARMKLEVAGHSVQGRPVYAAILTDENVDDDDKEHVAITTTHSGVERGATVSAMRLIAWLLSDDAIARETLRRQIVVVMPVCNPDGYVKPAFTNDHGFDAYGDWTGVGPKDLQRMPEALAIQKIFDRYQPEVVSDIHGNDMSFPGYIHFEGHVNNPSLRSYEPEVERLMNEAALEAGFPTHRGEADEQRIYAGAVAGVPAEKQSRKKPRIFVGTYAYLRFHSIMLATENAWPESCLVRHQRLLQMGNEVWLGERDRGYPTRTMMTHSHQIVACGKTAAERRRSRVELWNKQQLLTHGFDNPQRDGFVLYVCATTPEAARKWLGDGSLTSFQAAIKDHPSIDVAVILRELSDHPEGSGQWGPSAKLDLAGNRGRSSSEDRLGESFGMRLRIPYAKSAISKLTLNGRELEETAGDEGYHSWIARGYRLVQIDLSPRQLAESELFIVTCRYDPNEDRAQ